MLHKGSHPKVQTRPDSLGKEYRQRESIWSYRGFYYFPLNCDKNRAEILTCKKTFHPSLPSAQFCSRRFPLFLFPLFKPRFLPTLTPSISLARIRMNWVVPANGNPSVRIPCSLMMKKTMCGRVPLKFNLVTMAIRKVRVTRLHLTVAGAKIMG